MKKQFFSRAMALLLASMMLLSATGCNDRETTPEEPEEPAQEEPATTPEPEVTTPEEPEEPEEPEVKVEVPEQGEKLQEWIAKNGDIIGWLQVPDTEINAPVVQSSNNEFYYRLDELKNYSATGCYWADYECQFGPTSDDLFPSTVIYGHNVDYGGTGINPYSNNVGTSAPDEKDGDRFSQLFHFADIDWAKEHPYIYFSTPEEDLLWEVFAVAYTTDFNYIQILKDSKVSKTEPITEGQMMNIVNAQRERSEYDYADVEVNGDDKILTLSTCTYKYGKRNDVRFIVMAKLVTEDDTLVETANITLNEDKKAVQ